MKHVRTWVVELGVVAALEVGLALGSGGRALDWLGALAVTLSFAHAQVSDRLAEHAKLTDRFAANVGGHLGSPLDSTAYRAHCWRWAARYLVGKELAWGAFFVATRAWTALAGAVVFALYPLWRAWWRSRWTIKRSPNG